MTFAPKLITFCKVLGAIPALGGSKIKAAIFPSKSGCSFKNFPTSKGINWIECKPLMAAFRRASLMASSTMSTPIMVSDWFRFAISWAIVPVPQNKSNTTLFELMSSKPK